MTQMLQTTALQGEPAENGKVALKITIFLSPCDMKFYRLNESIYFDFG